jgi:hypothetical protein
MQIREVEFHSPLGAKWYNSKFWELPTKRNQISQRPTVLSGIIPNSGNYQQNEIRFLRDQLY